MKKLLVVSIICTALLCGCSQNEGNEISETSAIETSSAAVTTESSETTVAEAETTAEEITENTDGIILAPIPSDKPLEVMECEIISDFMTENEEEFPDKAVLEFAKEVCFEDEYVKSEIEEYNKMAYKEFGEDSDYVRDVGDIVFCQGGSYDFDMDGEDESIILLNYKPRFWGGGYLIYIDSDSRYDVFAADCNGGEVSVIKANNCSFMKIYITAGAIAYFEDIYSFESGMPKSPLNIGGNVIGYENGFFYCYVKYTNTAYPFVLCGDGVFRQLGREEITREDFEAHLENCGEYLDSLAEKGDEITKIYTYGYYNYQLCGGDFYYIVSPLRGEVHSDRIISSEPEEIRFTDEVVYGDVWAAQYIQNND